MTTNNVPTIWPLWYCVSKDGMATLCVDEDDANSEAANANVLDPSSAPFIALQLAPFQSAIPVDAEDAARYRAMRHAAASNDHKFLKAMTDYAEKHFADFGNPTADEFDAAVDYARRRIEGES